MVLQLLEGGMMLLKLNNRHLVREMMIGKEKAKVSNQEELLISITGAAPKTQVSMRIKVDLSVKSKSQLNWASSRLSKEHRQNKGHHLLILVHSGVCRVRHHKPQIILVGAMLVLIQTRGKQVQNKMHGTASVKKVVSVVDGHQLLLHLVTIKVQDMMHMEVGHMIRMEMLKNRKDP